jgi:SAM-dependent methyltransferase
MQDTATVETRHFGAVTVRHRDCPLCGANNNDAASSRYSEAPWLIKDCARCGFVYLDSTPQYEMQFETMAWETTTKVEEGRRAEIRPISYKLSKLTRFRMHILPRRSMRSYVTARCNAGNVLDLGCGDGHLLGALPPSFTPFGIEISSTGAATADRRYRARGGYALNAPSVEGLQHFSEGFFVAACLSSYLEHEAEPVPVLQSLWRALAPRGFAVVKVPNYGSLNRMVMGKRWPGFRYPDHLNYFTPKTLRAMADKAGFDTGFGAAGLIPASDNMWAVLTKRG